MSLGHEWVGIIEKKGKEVTGFEIGDFVTGETHVTCLQCNACKSGNGHRCLERKEVGILNRNGAFAEYLTYPVVSLHKISSSIPFEIAVLIEPLSVAVNAVRLTCGDSILNGLWDKIESEDITAELTSIVFVIFGDGPIGLLCLVALKALYKLTYKNKLYTIVVGATEERLKKAKILGADAIFYVGPGNKNAMNLESFVRSVNSGNLADYVIEATGQPSAVEEAIEVLNQGGRLTLLGVFGGKKALVNVDKIVLNNICVNGIIGSTGMWPSTIKLLERGEINFKEFITHKFSLKDYKQAIELVENRSDGVLKAIVVL